MNYDKYLKVCKEALLNEEVFGKFKQFPNYRAILEHVSYEQGLGYINEIKKDSPELLRLLSKFCENDAIGNPNVFYYAEIDRVISPTTLRYIKVLSDLRKYFGDLQGMNIVEIGVGYGGQCKIINDLFKFKSYTLVDLPIVQQLAVKCLDKHKVKNVTIWQSGVNLKLYDLCISNYAFTEIDRKYQEIYKSQIIDRSDRGYITCNFLDQRPQEEAFSKLEIITMKDKFLVIPEIPLTASHNMIYLWGTDHK
jgi:hypothetical protein